MSRRKPRSDHRADTRGGPLSGLPHAVSDSATYLHLEPFDRCVLAEILRKFNGYNNGEIGVSYEQIGERLRGPNKCRPNNGRIARSIVRLIEHGFLGEPTPESWLQRRARSYRLTFISSGKRPPFKAATNDYLRWTTAKAKIDGDAASPKQRPCDDARSPERPHIGDAASLTNVENGSFASAKFRSPGDARSPLIGKPYVGPSSSGLWWSADSLIEAQARLAIAVAAATSSRPLSAAA